MQIEVGKDYRTRGGEKVSITEFIDGYGYPFRGNIDDFNPQTWTMTGSFALSQSHPLDLIALWEEPTVTMDAEKPWLPLNEHGFPVGAGPMLDDAGKPIWPGDTAQVASLNTQFMAALDAQQPSAMIEARSQTHGDFSVNSEVSQHLKEYFRAQPGWQRLTIRQREAIDHQCGKYGRIFAGDPNFTDHWADLGGYAELAAGAVYRVKDWAE